MNHRDVLITRPLGQAQKLANAIAEAGGTALLFPTIEIHPIAPSARSLATLARVAEFDIAIFISANAVMYGLETIGRRGAWPENLLAFAIGQSTAQALRDAGLSAVRAPIDGNDSEALLRMPEMQSMTGKSVMIVRGKGGREVLAQVLQERGACVDYLECYERRLPLASPDPLRTAFSDGRIGAVIVNSVEGLENLFRLLDASSVAALVHCPMFVSHSRIAERARDKGINNAIVTYTGDDATIAALSAHFAPSRFHDPL